MNAILLLLALTGCVGNPSDDDTSNVGDADTDTDADSDTDSDVTFDVVLPMSATVTVNELPVPCDASLVCTVSAPGDGAFEVTVTSPTTYFIPKVVTVTDGVPSADPVTYAEGGCADEGWDGTAWCESGWAMSEYAPVVSGTYCDPQDRCVDAVMEHKDLNADGTEELNLFLDNFGVDFSLSGSLMYGYDDGIPDGFGYVSEDRETITFWFGTSLQQKIFTRD